jgi:hypothetical protein
MVDRKVVPFDEFYYQLKLTHVFQKHPVYLCSYPKNFWPAMKNVSATLIGLELFYFQCLFLRFSGREVNFINESSSHDNTALTNFYIT